MINTVIRHVLWRLGRDRAEGAPPPMTQLHCTSCGEASGVVDLVDFADAQTWAFGHVGRHPSHAGFREEITRFYRMTPDGAP